MKVPCCSHCKFPCVQCTMNAAQKQGHQCPLDTITNLRELELIVLRKNLQRTNGNREAAAKLSGISERNIYRMIKELVGSDSNAEE